MKKDEFTYLRHILERLNKIIEFTKDMDDQDFLNNNLVQEAVIRQFEVIGEATKKISSEFRNNYPTVPWKDMAGMRDKLIHGYEGVDYWIVWETVINDVPKIKDEIEKIINST